MEEDWSSVKNAERLRRASQTFEVLVADQRPRTAAGSRGSAGGWRYNRVVMSRTIHEIESELLQLDPHDRAALAKSLLHSLETLTEAEYEALWIEEGEARYAAFQSGQTSAVEGDEVLARARARNR